MNRGTVVGFITGGILGATAAMYATSNMSPRERKKAMRQTRRMLMKATGLMGMNLF
ncbi:hypothetical protein [Alkaliphilus crotonatoxidans]